MGAEAGIPIGVRNEIQTYCRSLISEIMVFGGVAFQFLYIEHEDVLLVYAKVADEDMVVNAVVLLSNGEEDEIKTSMRFSAKSPVNSVRAIGRNPMGEHKIEITVDTKGESKEWTWPTWAEVKYVHIRDVELPMDITGESWDFDKYEKKFYVPQIAESRESIYYRLPHTDHMIGPIPKKTKLGDLVVLDYPVVLFEIPANADASPVFFFERPVEPAHSYFPRGCDTIFFGVIEAARIHIMSPEYDNIVQLCNGVEMPVLKGGIACGSILRGVHTYN